MFKNKLISIINFLIMVIEKIEYRNSLLDEDDISKKILKSISLLDFKVKTDTGYEELSDLHITQPYKHYEISTNDFKLNCADNHIVFDKDLNQVFVKNLKEGDLIQTNKGIQKIKSVNKSKVKSSMFDTTVNSDNHRLYTNGILSHNTISSSIFILHFLLFNNDKNCMIIANKGDTVVEIVDKIKSIYTLLPFFLKTGVKVWNQKSITFENGCRIKTSARTKTPAVGFTIDLLYLDEFAHIPPNIINPFYTAAYPTVSAIENSKIIITSTPNGMNLFHKLLSDAERPFGDPKKNNYNAMRVYWYQVPGRFVTYVRLNEHKLYEQKIDKEYVLDKVSEKWGELTKVNMKFNVDSGKYVINVFNNDYCQDEDVKSFQFIKPDGKQISLMEIAELTTWKEEAIKNIGGEDAFNQEYGLRFINASRSLLNEKTIDDLLNNKVNYEWEELSEFEDKLNFSYDGLTWIDDIEIYNPIKRKEYKIIMSVDLSEGLGQDFSVINIFKIHHKSKEVIEIQKEKYNSINDFFKLQQIGVYRSNIVSLKQVAEILYILAFEYFNPENLKVVLELNNYGNTLLAEMPYVFEGLNDYGSSIFARYKHRVDADEEKPGLKVGNNKNLLVKDYQDLMFSKSFDINHEDTIREITTFVKHTTKAGNVKFAADTGNDDLIMTVINGGSIFKKPEFSEMINEWMSKHMDKEMTEFINHCIKNSEYIEPIDYGHFLNVKRTALRGRNVGYGRNKSNYTGNNNDWFKK